MKRVYKSIFCGLIVATTLVVTVRADPAAAYKLKKMYRAIGLSRGQAAAMWTSLNTLINRATTREALNESKGITVKQLAALIQAGSVRPFGAADVKKAEEDTQVLKKEQEIKFSFPLNRKQWIWLRQAIKTHVCMWLVYWLQDTKITLEQAAIKVDKKLVESRKDKERRRDENRFAVLAEEDLDDVIDTPEAKISVVEHKQSESIEVVDDEKLSEAEQKQCASLAKFADTNRYSLLEQGIDGIEA